MDGHGRHELFKASKAELGAAPRGTLLALDGYGRRELFKAFRVMMEEVVLKEE